MGHCKRAVGNAGLNPTKTAQLRDTEHHLNVLALSILNKATTCTFKAASILKGEIIT